MSVIGKLETSITRTLVTAIGVCATLFTASIVIVTFIGVETRSLIWLKSISRETFTSETVESVNTTLLAAIKSQVTLIDICRKEFEMVIETWSMIIQNGCSYFQFDSYRFQEKLL